MLEDLLGGDASRGIRPKHAPDQIRRFNVAGEDLWLESSALAFCRPPLPEESEPFHARPRALVDGTEPFVDQFELVLVRCSLFP